MGMNQMIEDSNAKFETLSTLLNKVNGKVNLVGK